MQSMADPVVGEIDEVNLQEMKADKKTDTVDVYSKVVYIGSLSQEEHKFVDVDRNRVFISAYPSHTLAYNDYLKTSRNASRVKLAMSEKKSEDDTTLMMRAMRVSIIAVVEKLVTGKKHQK